jgi:hypothetical protein
MLISITSESSTGLGLVSRMLLGQSRTLSLRSSGKNRRLCDNHGARADFCTSTQMHMR